MNESAWHCEYTVEADVDSAFAWSYWTDVRNWADPPAEFTLDGAFAAGSRGTTIIPGQEPVRWVIAEVTDGECARIEVQLDRAAMSFTWRFEPAGPCKTRITQRIELGGENTAAYSEAQAAFSSNLPDGMKRIAAAMAEAQAAARNAEG